MGRRTIHTAVELSAPHVIPFERPASTNLIRKPRWFETDARRPSLTNENDQEADGSIVITSSGLLLRHRRYSTTGVLYIYLAAMYSAKAGTRHEMTVLFQQVRKTEMVGSEEGEG